MTASQSLKQDFVASVLGSTDAVGSNLRDPYLCLSFSCSCLLGITATVLSRGNMLKAWHWDAQTAII